LPTRAASPTERGSRPPYELVAIGLITLLAAGLRLASLGGVPDDRFYDAAVRSMAVSAHNFFFGAYEPGGTIAIDKPPLDVWLQVISTQVVGFGPVALKLPPALCGTAAVPLLYDAVRRCLGNSRPVERSDAGFLPIAVLSSRSDTMDSVAMFLNVVALWLLVRFALSRQERWLYLAAASSARVQREGLPGLGLRARARADDLVGATSAPRARHRRRERHLSSSSRSPG